MLLYIIRHGDPDYDNDCLTEKGKKQAVALAKRLSVHGLDEIFTSPMGRARQTAQYTCEALGLEACVENWMSERLAMRFLCKPDKVPGEPWSNACQNTELLRGENLLRHDWYNLEPFAECVNAKEGYEGLSRSSDEFLFRLGYAREENVYKILHSSEKRVAAFCHDNFGRTWLAHLLSIPPHVFWASFQLTHSGVCILYFQNNPDGYTAPQCLCLSDTAHIYKDNLPLQFCNKINI